MSDRKFPHFLARNWPWWVLAVGIVALTFPLWIAQGQVFSEWLFKDGLNTAWIYGDVTRQLLEGHIPTHYDRFDWPCPRSRAEAPNWIDAAIVGPWTLFLEWPERWGAQMSSIIGINAFAVAFFAWALGARGWAVVYVGMMAAMLAPIWHELQAGRANGVWFGIPLATIGAYILLAKTNDETPLKSRIGSVILVAFTGYLTLTIYPPYAIMFAPVGALLLFAELRKNPKATGWILDATVIALMGALPILSVMGSHIDNYYGTAASCLGNQVWCVVDDGVATASSLFQLLPTPSTDFIKYTSLSAAFWLAAPAMLFTRQRVTWALCSLFALGLMFLSLGPCLNWRLPVGEVNGIHSSSEMWSSLWCGLQRIHRPERFALAAAGILVAGMGLGLQHFSKRGATARSVAIGIGLVSVLHSGWLLMSSVTQPNAWKVAPALQDIASLKDQPSQVVAALPFDGTYQYLSPMTQPQHYWVNSYQPERRTHSSHPAIAWLQRLGLGELDAAQPSAADWKDAGVDVVIYSTDRCGTSVIQPSSRCLSDLPNKMREVLGPPTTNDGRNLLWRLSPDPGAAATRTAVCGVDGEGEIVLTTAAPKRAEPQQNTQWEENGRLAFPRPVQGNNP